MRESAAYKGLKECSRSALAIGNGKEEGDDGGGNKDLDQQVIKLLQY